jgi:protein-S-isoprenylcysteine O-methyltransferase Ste14
MVIFDDPFFWAFLAAIGWAMGMLTVGSPSVGSHLLYGMVGSAMAQIPRVILPLPWVEAQPRFLIGEGASIVPLPLAIVAGVICMAAVFFGSSSLGLKIYTRPTSVEPLVISGRFAVVRHPILFANILWSVGWPILWGSWIGLATAPVWFLMVYLMSYIEEDRLVEAYGDDYRRYQKRVPRLIPFMKIL